MAFESLTDKLQNVFKNLRGKGRLSEADVKAALKEVKMALLEADVSFKVVKQFISSVQERAVGQDVLGSLSPAQMVIKIVNEELVKLMGSETTEIALKPANEITVIMGVSASIIKYIGKSQYSFATPHDMVEKDVHWYLMMADNYYSKPQREEYFVDSGYYKYHEAYHLLKFSNEKQILEKAYNEYLDLKKSNLWGSKKYF